MRQLYLEIKRNIELLIEEDKKTSRLIQRIRIHLGTLMHDYIMSPTINMGDPNDFIYDVVDDKGTIEPRPYTKADTTLLLYLYKGVDKKGNLLNQEDVKSVNNEIETRVEYFLENLDDREKAVFLRDSEQIIQFLKDSRNPKKESKYETLYLAKRAPGGFAHFDFAKRHRAIYADTTTYGGAIDFMFKSTPELHNINPSHLFLFKLENVIGRIANKIRQEGYSEEFYEKIEPLSYKQFYANYNQGTTIFTIEKELSGIKPIYQQTSAIKYYIIQNNNLLRLFYEDYLLGNDSKIVKDPMVRDTFQQKIQKPFLSFLREQEKVVKKYEYPRLLLRLRMMHDRGMIPIDLIDDANKTKMFSLFEKIKGFDDLDEYTFIFPLNPEKVPQEIRSQTRQKDFLDRTTVDKIKSFLDRIKQYVDYDKSIPLQTVEKFLNTLESLNKEEQKQISLYLNELEITLDDIEELIDTTEEPESTKDAKTSPQSEKEEYLDFILNDIEDYISNNETPDQALTSDLLKTMDTMTQKQLDPFMNRISAVIDFLEKK